MMYEVQNIDLSLLNNVPELNSDIVLEIRPLAPLSMVSEFPGSFYKTLQYPSKKMICGLFENMLGWHFSRALREEIFKDISKSHKKSKVSIKKDNYIEGSTYLPLLMDYFDISNISIKDFKSSCNYNDLWSRCFRRSDSGKHLNGCRNIDLSLVLEWNAIAKDDKIFKHNIDKIPCFYTSPTNREYVDIDAIMVFQLKVDARLLEQLLQICNVYNIGYLGNSEGWVELKLSRI